MTKTRRLRRHAFVAMSLVLAPFVLVALDAPARAQSPAPAAAAIPDKLSTLPPGQIEVGGELGRRMLVTLDQLLNLDVDGDFLVTENRTSTEGGLDGIARAAHGRRRVQSPRIPPALLGQDR